MGLASTKCVVYIKSTINKIHLRQKIRFFGVRLPVIAENTHNDPKIDLESIIRTQKKHIMKIYKNW